MRLEGKVAIITGAGSGMGRVAAQMFAAEGARVVVAEYDEKAGAETVDLVTGSGGEASFVRTDVSQETDAKAMVDHAVAAFGRVDVLYNNAGVMPEPDHSVIDTEVAVWDQVMAVNLRGVFLGCKYAIPQMLEQGSGSVINISSFVALLGCSVPQDAYTASKGAVLSLTRSLAVQFGPRGVRSNAICPGPIETPLLMDWLLKDEAAKQLRLARNPTGRFGKPEEIVNAAIYLASDESRWTNGAHFVIDGGISVNYFCASRIVLIRSMVRTSESIVFWTIPRMKSAANPCMVASRPKVRRLPPPSGAISNRPCGRAGPAIV